MAGGRYRDVEDAREGPDSGEQGEQEGYYGYENVEQRRGGESFLGFSFSFFVSSLKR
jgi:hypothetical protein